jgi:hypothetical protein
MPRRNSSLEILEARKSLLLLEADLHRQQLGEEWSQFKNSFHSIEEATLKPARSLLSLAGLAIAGLAAFRRSSKEKGSWLPRIFKFVTAFWGILPGKTKE